MVASGVPDSQIKLSHLNRKLETRAFLDGMLAERAQIPSDLLHEDRDLDCIWKNILLLAANHNGKFVANLDDVPTDTVLRVATL